MIIGERHDVSTCKSVRSVLRHPLMSEVAK